MLGAKYVTLNAKIYEIHKYPARIELTSNLALFLQL